MLPSESDLPQPTQATEFESGTHSKPDSDTELRARNCETEFSTPVPKPAPPDARRPASLSDSRTETANWKSSAANSIVIPGYEVLATLGRGAMGVVYQARQTSLNRIVALKVLVGGAHASDEERARFRTEALTVAQLQHPNIIQVHDVGEHDGIPFLAIEYVGGGNLQQWLAGKPMSVQGAVRLIYSVARAVGVAHAKGIIHRDLKPANILLTPDGVPKIADFGLAKQQGSTNYTATGTILGTPQYMAPEQAAGLTKRIGPACDVYSLGVILYECLTGRPPFATESVIQLLDQIRFAEPVPTRQWRRDVPEEVDVVVRRCLHKVPEERYRSADALADDLARIISRWDTEQAQGEEPTGAEGADYGRAIAIVGVTLLLVLGLFAAWESGLFKRRPPAATPPPPPAKTMPADGPIPTP